MFSCVFECVFRLLVCVRERVSLFVCVYKGLLDCVAYVFGCLFVVVLVHLCARLLACVRLFACSYGCVFDCLVV